jgi:hypothetical protein
MWRLKGCPKCKGDIFLEKDIDGWYERCLQCGYNQDLETIVEVKAKGVSSQAYSYYKPEIRGETLGQAVVVSES